jgi:ribosome-associated toxin RatA of RatAB toxin-antitoxin module
MSTVSRRATVRFSADQMFDLVNDVESYPQFLHWCRDARVIRRDGDTVEASLDIGLGGIHKTFATRNCVSRPNRIGIELLSGPFRRLEGGWTFADLDQGGSTVELELDYEMKGSPLSVLFAAAFEEIARSQMNAFVKRAEQVYGA